MNEIIIKKGSKSKDHNNWNEISSSLKLSGMATAMVKHGRGFLRKLNISFLADLHLCVRSIADIDHEYHYEIREALEKMLKNKVKLRIFYKDGRELCRSQPTEEDRLDLNPFKIRKRNIRTIE